MDFAKNERYKIFKKFTLDLKSKDTLTILEAASHNGRYYGLFILEDSAYYYFRDASFENKGWTLRRMLLTDIFKDGNIKLNVFILDKILNWDKNYINNPKIGEQIFINGGHSFMATRIIMDDIPILETLLFEEFVNPKDD